MKNKLIIAALALSIATVYSCKSDKKAQGEGGEQLTEQQQTDQLQGSVTFKDEKTGTVYNYYIGVKEALVKTDAGKAQKEAKMLIAALSELDNADKALQFAGEIEVTDDVEVQRKSFFGLSEEITSLVSGQITSGAIYKQYCPMAFNNEGAYWLSSEEAVLNPYFGDKMLKCGTVQEVLE
ncbi:DUF3347 domain-containing protein [Sinomicrobium sp.]